MVGVHPKEDKPGFQVELARSTRWAGVLASKNLLLRSPSVRLEGRLVNLLFYYTASPSLVLHNVADLFQIDSSLILSLCFKFKSNLITVLMIYHIRIVFEDYPSFCYIVIKLIGLVETRIGGINLDKIEIDNVEAEGRGGERLSIKEKEKKRF